jgi:hypothetical protein
MQNAVVRNAVLACSCGSAMAVLLPTSEHSVAIGNATVATVADSEPNNVGPFGQCSKGGPCVPACPGPWTPGSGTVTIDGHRILRTADVLLCSQGGTIRILAEGQASTHVT